MHKVFLTSTLILILTATASYAMPKEKTGGDCASCHTLTVKEAGDLIGKMTGGGKVTEVRQSPVQGLFEVHLEVNGQKGVAHIDYGKKHVVPGLIFEIATGKPTVAPPQPPPAAKIDVSRIPIDNSVIMGNPKGAKKLFVFTDTDCPYCSRMHMELKKLVVLNPDVTVYVKMFPLKMHPGAFDKSRAILTAKHPAEMLDRAFAGGELSKPADDAGKAAVDATIKFGEANGITSTPTLILPDGVVIVGGRDAESLNKLISGN